MTRRARVTAGLVAAGLVLAVAGCSASAGSEVAGSDRAADDRDGAAPTAPATTFSVRSEPARPAASQHDTAVPRRLTLPSGTTVEVRPAPTTPSGRLGVPDDVDAAGWWDGGARLGDRVGAMLVAAHVDSVEEGLGPFAELLGARRGDRVTVAGRDVRTRFVVARVRLVDRDDVDDLTALSSARGRLRLVLVTCAGPFVPARGGYQDLAVVTAVPAGAPRRADR